MVRRGSGIPAHGKYEPFKPGHTLSLHHGAYSERTLAPVARARLTELLALAEVDGSPVSYLLDPSYAGALRAWAKAEAQQELLERWLDKHGGPIDDDGKVRGAADLLERVARRAERLRARLGLDPVSRAGLAKDLAVARSGADLERLKAIGAELLAARSDGEVRDVDG